MFVRKMIVKSASPFIIKGLEGVIHHDELGQMEFERWPTNLIFSMTVATEPDISIAFIKEDHHLRPIKMLPKDNVIPIRIVFKDLKHLFRIFIGRYSASQAFADNRLYVYGDLRILVSVLKVIDQLFAYLFPRFILKKIYIRIPRPKGKRSKVVKTMILR